MSTQKPIGLSDLTSAQLRALPGMEKTPDASLPGKSVHDMLMLLAVNRVTVGRITQNDIERAFGKGERK